MNGAKSRYHTMVNDGNAYILAEVTGGEGEGEKKWTEQLVGLLKPKNDKSKLHLLKFGSMDSKYSARELSENNSNRRAGSKTETLSEGMAKDWLAEGDIDEGKLDDFLEAYKTLQSFK